MVLDSRLPDPEHLRGNPSSQAVGAEGAQADRDGRSQGAQDEKRLQAGFLLVFFSRCGRFLP